jgi:hypothetical protein
MESSIRPNSQLAKRLASESALGSVWKVICHASAQKGRSPGRRKLLPPFDRSTWNPLSQIFGCEHVYDLRIMSSPTSSVSKGINKIARQNPEKKGEIRKPRASEQTQQPPELCSTRRNDPIRVLLRLCSINRLGLHELTHRGDGTHISWPTALLTFQNDAIRMRARSSTFRSAFPSLVWVLSPLIESFRRGLPKRRLGSEPVDFRVGGFRESVWD